MKKSIINTKFNSFLVAGFLLSICTYEIIAQEPVMDVHVPVGWAVVPSHVVREPMSGQKLESTTGGNEGRVVRATSRSDFGYLCMSPEALVILAEGSFGPTSVGSNKTLIGTGSGARGTFKMSGVGNIIIRNFIISGGVDGIGMSGTNHVWIDHCDFSDCSDGLLDITHGSDKVTATWCKFSNHLKPILINSGCNHDHERDRLNVTLTHLFFNQNNERNPRAGMGMVHILNCYYKSCGKVSSEGYGVHIWGKSKTVVERCNFVDTKDAISHHKAKPNGPNEPGYCYLIENEFDAVSKVGLTPETEKDKIFQIDDYYMYDWTVIDAKQVPEIIQKGVGTGAEWSKAGPIPIPGQGAVNVSKTPTLRWTKAGAKASNMVYFGKTFPPPKLKTVDGNSFQPGDLDGGTVYYWKINDNGVWKFRTEGQAPTNIKQFVSVNSNPDALTLYLNQLRSELKLNLKDNFLSTGRKDLILYDCLGKVVRKETTFGDEHIMHVKILPHGVYYISLSGKQGKIVRKFIKN